MDKLKQILTIFYKPLEEFLLWQPWRQQIGRSSRVVFYQGRVQAMAENIPPSNF